MVYADGGDNKCSYLYGLCGISNKAAYGNQLFTSGKQLFTSLEPVYPMINEINFLSQVLSVKDFDPTWLEAQDDVVLYFGDNVLKDRSNMAMKAAKGCDGLISARLNYERYDAKQNAVMCIVGIKRLHVDHGVNTAKVLDISKSTKIKQTGQSRACEWKEREKSKLKAYTSLNGPTLKNEKLKEEALKLTKFEKSTHYLNEMLNNQKPSSKKLGLGFNSFEASSSGTKEIKFMKAQKKAFSDGGPINMGGPLSVQAAPKANMGPPPATTPGSEKIINLRGNIIGKGTISSDSLNIDNVEHVDNLRFNLLSIGKICDNKCRVTFFEHDSEITKDGKVIGRGIRKKGLYVMILGNKPKDQICLATIDENFTLWHRRLDHVNMCLIQSLASKELVRNLPKLKFDQHFCDACKIGKQAHASHKAKNIVSITRCLELLHMDLFDPSAVRSYRGNRYTLVIVDDYSRYTWIRFLKDKTKTFNQFEIFSKKIQNQLGCTIVSIRTNHGREFDNEVQFGEFCNVNGITHNFSAPRTPQSNGIVERKNKKLQEMSRTMLNEQSLPQKFWCNTVDTSTYILN
ncbi:retrovirus-related pol polyprotein from transposon TNT 1-94 [Tanacetum coccineum]|uniref:Retrovirus-related pol polyprotein from transposon TNT 1-94 n=1 Tax=Tanacetum coccineum TaxID=301880 RepID=A0ABQ5DBJ3_9ASTR